MAFSLRGIHPPHRKNTTHKPIAYMDAPSSVTVPMSMHIGTPAIPTVKVGDAVRVGTQLGVADGRISSNIYSGISGRVTKIADCHLPGGTVSTAVTVESDGGTSVDPLVCPPTVNTREDLISALRSSGIVGLGGAGFPTHAKLDVPAGSIEYLIINGAECEPYVTVDTVTMLTESDSMSHAIRVLSRLLGIKNVIIGIEDNKRDAIASMRAMAASVDECSVTVKKLPSLYPQGGEKVLIYRTVGRKVPTGGLPIDVGCTVLNCTTLAAVGSYLRCGMPLVKRCVTVDGGAVKAPQNVVVPIGTSVGELLSFCGGITKQPAKLMYGGPMMGIAVPDGSYPILKNTNAILALTEEETKAPKTTSCIRCGSCTNVCPFGLAPASIASAAENGDTEELTALFADTCMECGCCSYVCPAHRPLILTNRLAKRLLLEKRGKEAGGS